MKNTNDNRSTEGYDSKNSEANFDLYYLKWKNWNEDEFGTLEKSLETYYDKEIQKTKKIFPPNSIVLEVGFGNGAFLTFAKKKKWKIFGTEINQNLVKIAKDKGFNSLKTDTLNSFSDNIFDLVVAWDVLEHMPQEKIMDFFHEIKRIIKSEGFFIGRFPNGDSPFGLKNQNGDITHITAIGSGKVKYFSAKNNFELIYVGGEAQPILNTGCLYFLHRLLTLPIKKILNFFVNIIFYPKNNISFCSSNIVMVIRNVK